MCNEQRNSGQYNRFKKEDDICRMFSCGNENCNGKQPKTLMQECQLNAHIVNFTLKNLIYHYSLLRKGSLMLFIFWNNLTMLRHRQAEQHKHNSVVVVQIFESTPEQLLFYYFSNPFQIFYISISEPKNKRYNCQLNLLINHTLFIII